MVRCTGSSAGNQGMGAKDLKNQGEKPISRASAPKLLRRPAQQEDGVPVRVEFGTDSSTSVTTLRTPEPLPPSPAAADAEGWFEQVPTNPAAIPDLSALAGSDSDSVPTWAQAARKAESAKSGQLDSTYQIEKHRSRWILPLLLAAACLAVGMVLGALLQSRFGSPDESIIECPDPSAHQTPGP